MARRSRNYIKGGRSMEKVLRRKKKVKITPFKFVNYSIFVLMGLATLYPLWYVFMGSLMPYHEFIKSPFIIFPKNASLEAYKSVFKNNTIMPAMTISVVTSLLGTLLSMVLTILGAYVFSVKKFPFKNFLFGVVIFTMLFGGGVIPMYITLARYGMVDHPIVYIVPGAINTFYLIILKNAFQGVPLSLREAAEMDGCGQFKLLLKVYLPLSLPTIATITLFYAVDKWSDLYSGIYYINSAKYYNLQMVLYNMLSGNDSSVGTIVNPGATYIAEQVKYASVMVTTIPVLLVYPFLQKYFVKGVLFGALKD
jgi:putative aldouronate transport system permease protein